MDSLGYALLLLLLLLSSSSSLSSLDREDIKGKTGKPCINSSCVLRKRYSELQIACATFRMPTELTAAGRE